MKLSKLWNRRSPSRAADGLLLLPAELSQDLPATFVFWRCCRARAASGGLPISAGFSKWQLHCQAKRNWDVLSPKLSHAWAGVSQRVKRNSCGTMRDLAIAQASSFDGLLPGFETSTRFGNLLYG